MMPRRTLGRTGRELSVVGFGGIVVMDEEPASAARLVAQAIERGINYFDVAPSYGNAMERLGPALAPHRDSLFLACKTLERDRAGAARELEDALRLLQTDCIDLYQFHAVTTHDDVERVTATDGALTALVEARKRGWIRHIGFSAHDEDAAIALLDRFEIDSVLFPFNWASWYAGRFGPRLLERARQLGVGLLGLKALARRRLGDGEPRPWAKCWYEPVDNPQDASLGLRFALSLPIAAAVSPGHAEHLWWACDAAETLQPLTDEESAELARRAAAVEPVFANAV